MQYCDKDIGPFHLIPAQRLDKNLISQQAQSQRMYIKSELLETLNTINFVLPQVQDKYNELGVSLKTPEEDKIAKVWIGKSKGMLEILWERGYIDESKLNEYTFNGKKDVYSTINLSTSLKHMLSS